MILWLNINFIIEIETQGLYKKNTFTALFNSIRETENTKRITNELNENDTMVIKFQNCQYKLKL